MQQNRLIQRSLESSSQPLDLRCCRIDRIVRPCTSSYLPSTDPPWTLNKIRLPSRDQTHISLVRFVMRQLTQIASPDVDEPEFILGDGFHASRKRAGRKSNLHPVGRDRHIIYRLGTSRDAHCARRLLSFGRRGLLTRCNRCREWKPAYDVSPVIFTKISTSCHCFLCSPR